MTPYFTSGHQSSSCKGACTDVIRIQTQHYFCCFLSYARVELLSISLQGFNVECINGRISHMT